MSAEILAYHGTPAKVQNALRGSHRGTFGAGVYLGDKSCAEQYAINHLYQVRLPLASLYACHVSYDVGELFDVDTPAIPLLMKLFDESAEQSVLRWLSWADSQGHLGGELRPHIEALGFHGMLLTYEPNVFEVVWFSPVECDLILEIQQKS